MSNFDTALKYVLFVEGGYSDHPEDKGGKTKYGITELTYNRYVRSSTGRDVWPTLEDIDKKMAADIYRGMYWNAVKGDQLPAGVSLMVFDSAVHAGPTRAIQWLQGAVNVKQDGIIGPMTLEAAHSRSAVEIIKRIAKSRLMLARNNETFVSGWFNRILFILQWSTLRWAQAAFLKQLMPPQAKDS